MTLYIPVELALELHDRQSINSAAHKAFGTWVCSNPPRHVHKAAIIPI
jgi:hypothetical protein